VTPTAGFHETIAEDETARFEGYAAELGEIQRLAAQRHGAISRALHAKTHVGAVGEFVVSARGTASTGIFAESGRAWPIYARFSNGSSGHQADKVPDVRGVALKLVGVPGKKIIPGLEHEGTQDFLFIPTPSIPFRDPEEFMIFVRAAKDGPAKLLPKVIAGYGLRRGFTILRRVLGSPKVRSLATHPFHTAAPISFGKTAAKLGLFPLEASILPVGGGRDFLREDLFARLKSAPLSWALRGQMFLDDQKTPIEDTSVTWSGPWLDLGTLTLPRQDPESPRGREIGELVDQLSFDPWHSIEAHRPLGAIMRARAVAYRASVLGRNAAPEPKGVLGP
jgi:Catalase